MIRKELFLFCSDDTMRKAEDIAWEGDKEEAFADFVAFMAQEEHIAPKTLAEKTGVPIKKIQSILLDRGISLDQAEWKEEMCFSDFRRCRAWDLWWHERDTVLWSLALRETKYLMGEPFLYSLLADGRLSAESIAKILGMGVEHVEKAKNWQDRLKDLGAHVEEAKEANLESFIVRAIEDGNLSLPSIAELFGVSLEDVTALKEEEESKPSLKDILLS